MKNLRKVALVCTFVFVVMAVIGSVYGVTADFTVLDKGEAADDVATVGGSIWKTVTSIVQILAVAAVVFAGVRYMFASADAKADIKKQTVILIVGAVLVFGATYILGFVTKVTNSLVGNY